MDVQRGGRAQSHDQSHRQTRHIKATGGEPRAYAVVGLEAVLLQKGVVGEHLLLHCIKLREVFTPRRRRLGHGERVRTKEEKKGRGQFKFRNDCTLLQRLQTIRSHRDWDDTSPPPIATKRQQQIATRTL